MVCRSLLSMGGTSMDKADVKKEIENLRKIKESFKRIHEIEKTGKVKPW